MTNPSELPDVENWVTDVTARRGNDKLYVKDRNNKSFYLHLAKVKGLRGEYVLMAIPEEEGTE